MPPSERLPSLSTAGSAALPGGEVDVVELLSRGDLEVEGRIVGASNATLLAVVRLAGVEALCVHKPVAGERPLHDFPRGSLAGREVAAYLVSAAAGWGVVPPTVLRDGPFGPGSAQLWVHPEGAEQAQPGAGLVDVVPAGAVPQGWLAVVDAYGADGEPVTLAHADDERLAVLAGFDVVVNNADRKGGHVLLGAGDALRGVDHGLTFHVDPKLRTVLWGFAGRSLPPVVTEALPGLQESLDDGPLARDLEGLLSADEVAALRRRVGMLCRRPVHPRPPQHRYPYPWPPF